MDRLRTEWDKTSTASKVILGVLLLAALVFFGLSFAGVFDPFGVSEGVATVEPAGAEVPAP